MACLFNIIAILSIGFSTQNLYAATPLVEFISKPGAVQAIKPQNTNLLFYTIRNNTSLRLPLSYFFTSPLVSLTTIGSCGTSIAQKSTCTVAFQYQAPVNDTNQIITIGINYQGRVPLIDSVTMNVDSNIACTLLPEEAYESSFCQQQYQNLIKYSPNVFNVSNQNVMQEQTLGGTIGIYQNTNNQDQICYISCGLQVLNGKPPTANTLFELASVTKTLTTSILGKFLIDGTVSLASDPVAPSLPMGYALGNNENSVTFQQLATFSGGVCFSDAPDVNQQSMDQVLNQNNFISDINNLNPDPTSGRCSDGKDNVQQVYTSPSFLPSKNRYSNSSVGLLGQALMNIDGFGVLEPGFNDWMCKNLVDVLDMTRTNSCLPNDAINGTCGASVTHCANSAIWASSDYADGYHVTDNNVYEQGSPFPFMPWAAAGGIRSNAVDMIKFIRANLGFSTNNNVYQMQLIQGMALAHQANDYLPSPGTILPNIGSQNPLVGGQGYAWVCMPSTTGNGNICGKIGGHTNFRSFVGLNTTQNYGIVLLFNTGAKKTNGSLGQAATPPAISDIGTNMLENSN